MSTQAAPGQSGEAGGYGRLKVGLVIAVVLFAVVPAAGFALPFVGMAMAATAATAGIAELFGQQVGTYCPSADTTVTTGGITAASLTADQLASARTIVNAAAGAIPDMTGTIVDHTAQQRAAVIAVATAMQESHLTDLPSGDLDSVGLFQQRPSMGWGTVEQLTNPTYATDAFLLGSGSNPGLVNIADWQTIPLTQAAQAVQKSAYPDAYAVWESLATQIVGQLWGSAGATPVPKDLTRHPGATDTTLGLPSDTECGGGTTGTSGATTGGQLPGPWGGYANGQIPTGQLCVVTFSPTSVSRSDHAGMYLRCDAEHALEAVNAAYKADHGGQSLALNDAYRTVAEQQSEADAANAAGHPDTAAQPGTSPHGWALAVDFHDFGTLGTFTSPNYLWMKQHGGAYGWVHEAYMEPGGSGPYEPWHFDFAGSPENSATPAGAAAATSEATR